MLSFTLKLGRKRGYYGLWMQMLTKSVLLNRKLKIVNSNKGLAD